MAKRCLSCGKSSDNQLYVCSVCLNRLNEVRRPLELMRRFKKKTLLATSRFVKVLFILPISMLALLAAMTVTMFYKAGFSPFVRMIIIFPSLIGFLTYFFAGAIFGRYTFTIWLRQLLDKKYYAQTFLDRLKDVRGLIPVSVLLILFFVSGVTVTIIVQFMDTFWKLRLPEPLWLFRAAVIRGFSSAGFLFGVYLSQRYSDWIKELEK